MAIKRITTNLIKDSDIATVDIANNAITAAKITDGNITTAKLADLSVTAGKLAGTLDLTGKTITVATATTGDSDTSPASTAFVQQEIAALVDSSPSSLNTLNELAAALGDDASFSTTVTNSIATKLPLAGGTMTGDLKVGATIASTGGTTNSRGMLLAHQNNTNQSYVGRSENGVADTGNRITFDYDNDKMQLDSDGDIVLTPTSNVGINDTNPSQKLSVSGTGSVVPARFTAGGNTNTLEVWGNSTASTSTGILCNAGTNENDYSARFRKSDGTIIMEVRGDGNVGIGRTDPTQLLEVHKNAGGDQTVAKFSAHNYGDTGKTFIEIGTEYGDGSSRIGSFNDTGNKSVLVFDVHSATSGQFSEKMRIDSAGKIKIGNNIPMWSGSYGGALFLKGNNATSDRYAQLCIVDSTGAIAQQGLVVRGGNVGIGETSPDNILHIKTTASGGPQIQMGDGTNYGFINFDGQSLQISTQRDMVDGTWYNTSKSWGGINIIGESIGSKITMATAGNSNTSPTTHFLLDRDGHLILGSSTTQAGKLSVYTDATNDPAIYGYRSTSSFKIVPFLSNGAFSSLSNVNDSGLFFSDNFVIAKHASGNYGAVFFGNGSFSIGTDAEATGSTGGVTFSADSSNRRNLILATTSTGNLELIEFRNPNGTVGTIKTNGTSTSYNTSSDYRLKENVTYEFNALDRVTQLKPARFNFITDADTVLDGFLAHEVSDIVPEAVSGEKDATKEKEIEVTPAQYEDDGETLISEAVMETRTVPVYQGIDQSKLVPLLTKAIQEQQTIIDDLKSRIETLEG